MDSLKSIGGKRNTYKRKIFLPIVVFMKLNRGGGLSISDTPPWIPRIWLSPNVGQNQPIGDLSAYDDFVSENPYEAVATWQELQEYCNGLLEAVAEKSLQAETIHDDYTRVNQAIIDSKCKNKAEIEDFNQYLANQLEARLPLNIPLHISPEGSTASSGLQAVDLFCWGVYRKYEHSDIEWYQRYGNKIVFETEYLGNDQE